MKVWGRARQAVIFSKKFTQRHFRLTTGDVDIPLPATPIFEQQANGRAYLGVI